MSSTEQLVVPHVTKPFKTGRNQNVAIKRLIIWSFDGHLLVLKKNLFYINSVLLCGPWRAMGHLTIGHHCVLTQTIYCGLLSFEFLEQAFWTNERRTFWSVDNGYFIRFHSFILLSDVEILRLFCHKLEENPINCYISKIAEKSLTASRWTRYRLDPCLARRKRSSWTRWSSKLPLQTLRNSWRRCRRSVSKSASLSRAHLWTILNKNASPCAWTGIWMPGT